MIMIKLILFRIENDERIKKLINTRLIVQSLTPRRAEVNHRSTAVPSKALPAQCGKADWTESPRQ